MNFNSQQKYFVVARIQDYILVLQGTEDRLGWYIKMADIEMAGI